MKRLRPFAGLFPIFYRELLVIRSRMPKQLFSWLVSPLLYFTAFTCAMDGAQVAGRPYGEFLLPGLAAMVSMTQSWAIAAEINIARFYWRTMDEFMACPLSASGYAAGEVLAGMFRAVCACSLVLAAGRLAGIQGNLLAPGLWAALLLNAFFFASLACATALNVKGHADQAMLANFVIAPMGFLGGTFFPLERLPAWAGALLGLLPLPHAAKAMRDASAGLPLSWPSLAGLAAGGVLACLWAVASVRRVREQ